MLEGIIEWKRKEESYLMWDIFSKWFKIKYSRDTEKEKHSHYYLEENIKGPTSQSWDETGHLWMTVQNDAGSLWSALALHYLRTTCSYKNFWEKNGYDW